MMRLTKVVLRQLSLPMTEPFETSFGVETDKAVIVVEACADTGAVGFAECVASAAPLYSSETNDTAWHVLEDFLIPALLQRDFRTTEDLLQIRQLLKPYRGHQMAKAALEMAIWDLFANAEGIPLVQLLGGTKGEVDVGISIGIQRDVTELLKKVDGYLEQGFKRFKVKVKPGWDMRPLTAIRKHFGDVRLMADANSAYTLQDVDRLKQFDNFNLMMVEQPLAHDDIVDHARLQAQLTTPICLDESIHSAEDVRKAAELGACRVINLKLGRVGGFGEALAIHDLCQSNGLDLWCGGMLETGIGRLHNIAFTALPGFNLPGDTAPSARYFHEDIIEPPVTFLRPGTLAVEPLAGVASRVDRQRLDRHSVRTQAFPSEVVT